MAQEALLRSFCWARERMKVPSSCSAHGDRRMSCNFVISGARASIVREIWAVRSFWGPVMSIVWVWWLLLADEAVLLRGRLSRVENLKEVNISR